MEKYSPQIFILIGLLFTALGGFISYVRMIEYRNSTTVTIDKNNQLSTDNQLLLNTNNQLTNQNLELTCKNQELINQNIELSEKTKELSTSIEKISSQIKSQANEIRDHQTGGNSYMKISLNDFDSEKTGTLVAYGKIVGEHPIYNVSIQYQQTFEMGESPNPMNHFKFESISPGNSKPLGRVKIPKNGEYGIYSFSVFSRNNDYTNYLWVHKVDKKFKCWTQVYDDLMLKNKIDETIQKGFPINAEGNPIWPPAMKNKSY